MSSFQHEEEVEAVWPNAWSSELPADLIGMITDNLSLSEFIRFGCVCLGWRCFSIENYQHIKLPNNKLPMLLIPIPPSSSSLLLTDHHKKNISFPPLSCDDDDEDDVEELELEEEEKEKVVITHKEEEKEKVVITHKEEEKDSEKEKEKETGDEKEKEAEEEEEDEVVRCPVYEKFEPYYNPNEMWQGQDAKQRHKNSRTFYSLSEKKVYHNFRFPVPYYKNILGSSHGWLVAVEECFADNNGQQLYLPVSLLNPFRTDNNNNVIQLPPITEGNPGNLDIGERITDSHFLIKAILSANPSSLSDPTTQLVVFGIYGRYRLAFCRPGDKAWTRLDLEEYRPITDVICYNGQIYAILQNGSVFAFHFDATDHPLPIVTLEISPPEEIDAYHMGGTPKSYLVESEGDLLQIRRYIGRPLPPKDSSGYVTRQFLVSSWIRWGSGWR